MESPTFLNSQLVVNFALLERKLELARRRAQHAAIKQVGKATYDGLAKGWDRFLQWIRYFILYGPQYISSFRLMRKPGSRMHIWKYQRDEMVALAERVIERRSYTKIADDVLRKNVDLAISELRRGRYPGLTVMTVIHEQRLGADFMFDFLSARADLEPPKPVANWYERALSPVEKFKMSQNRVTTTAPPTSEQNSEPSGPAPSSSVVVQQSSAAALATVSTALPPFATAIPFTAEDLADAVAKWLRDWIPNRLFWESVIEEARHQVIRRPADFLPPSTSAASLEELIDLCRPKEKLPDPSEDAGDAPEELNYLVDWLLGWLAALKSDVVPWSAFAWQTCGILRAGFGRAKKSLAAKA